MRGELRAAREGVAVLPGRAGWPIAAVRTRTEQRDDSSLRHLPHHPAAVLFERVLDASPSRFGWTTTMLGLQVRDFSGADASLDRWHPSWERDEAVRSESP
jgi:hypothetical protein